MKDPHLSSSEEQLTRWIDGMPGAQPPAGFPDAAREKEAAESLAALVRAHAPAQVEPPYADFFNSQLLKKIRDEEAAAAPRASAPQKTGGWLHWLRSPWFAGLSAATAAVLLMTAILPVRTEIRDLTTGNGTRVLSVFSPEPHASAVAQPASDGSAIIISVEGLEAYPDDRALAGYAGDDTQPLIASLSR